MKNVMNEKIERVRKERKMAKEIEIIYRPSVKCPECGSLHLIDDPKEQAESVIFCDKTKKYVPLKTKKGEVIDKKPKEFLDYINKDLKERRKEKNFGLTIKKTESGTPLFGLKIKF